MVLKVRCDQHWKSSIFQYTCALFLRMSLGCSVLFCAGLGSCGSLGLSGALWGSLGLSWWCRKCHWSLAFLILLNYDCIPLSKSLIFRYTCALFCRTRFQHTCLTSQIIDFQLVLATFWKTSWWNSKPCSKNAYKTLVFLMVLEVRRDQRWKSLIFHYTCDKSSWARLVLAIFDTFELWWHWSLVMQKMSLVLVIFDTFELWWHSVIKIIDISLYVCTFLPD